MYNYPALEWSYIKDGVKNGFGVFSLGERMLKIFPGGNGVLGFVLHSETCQIHTKSC